MCLVVNVAISIVAVFASVRMCVGVLRVGVRVRSGMPCACVCVFIYVYAYVYAQV